jgi:hypothetical protein
VSAGPPGEPDHPPAPEAIPQPVPSAGESLAGWCAPEVRAEFPELRLLSVQASVDTGRSLTGASPPPIHARLRALSDRWKGAHAIAVRQRPIPAAYRVFYCQIGLDPEVRRTPLERAVLERMVRGGFLSDGLLADILTIALVDTGVPVWALDTATLDGPLGVRASQAGEAVPAGRLVVADAARALAQLFDEPAPPYAAHADTSALTLYAIQVAGVPLLHVEEALWSCLSTLEWVEREL